MGLKLVPLAAIPNS
jgi:MHS family proline/betaine transporter-like MFS transporter